MNWEKYGLRIGVQEGSLLSSETVEAAVVALVGGQFEFPPNTVLVSAVYAVSLSKPLLKRLKLEIQHCIDLTGQPDLAQYLKFAIAPVSTPSLPYQFKLVEGGEFSFNSGYGSIQRKKFCLVCILGEEWTNGGGNGVLIASVNAVTEEEEEQQPQQEENEEEEDNDNQEEEQNEERGKEEEEDDNDSNSDDDTSTSSTPPGASGACKESTTNLPTNTVSVAGPTTTPNTDHVNTQSTCVRKAVTYTGLVYYEEDGVEDLVTFTAAKNLEALIYYIEQKCSQAKIGPDISFSFKFPYDYIELNFTAPQKKPFTGWTLNPHTDPCRLYQEAIDKFGDKEHSRPSCCLISVYGSPDAVPFLNYFIPLEGVARPVSLNIHKARRNFTVPVSPTTNPTTSSSSSNTITEATASSTGGASAPVTVDVKKVKKVINDVLVSHHADLNSLKTSLSDLASQLYTAGLISDEVKETRSMETFIAEFKASLNFKRKLPQ
uniref:Death domain-containing protein n=1 Tax=Amphimedon queenslandica TaxID=400682 RepID=A0A1X7SQG8_AMPQE